MTSHPPSQLSEREAGEKKACTDRHASADHDRTYTVGEKAGHRGARPGVWGTESVSEVEAGARGGRTDPLNHPPGPPRAGGQSRASGDKARWRRRGLPAETQAKRTGAGVLAMFSARTRWPHLVRVWQCPARPGMMLIQVKTHAEVPHSVLAPRPIRCLVKLFVSSSRQQRVKLRDETRFAPSLIQQGLAMDLPTNTVLNL
jgi:hypothetical protein